MKKMTNFDEKSARKIYVQLPKIQKINTLNTLGHLSWLQYFFSVVFVSLFCVNRDLFCS